MVHPNLKGPWSSKGVLFLRHVCQRMPVYETLNIDWVAKQVNTSSQQLRYILSTDNPDDKWFWRYIQILEQNGWPTMYLVVCDGKLHYDAIKKDCIDVDIVWHTNKHTLRWNMNNE